jgi:hypothetical protein
VKYITSNKYLETIILLLCPKIQKVHSNKMIKIQIKAKIKTIYSNNKINCKLFKDKTLLKQQDFQIYIRKNNK